MNLALHTSTTSLTLSVQMKEALSEIIQLATVDSEPWVLMVADILKSFPETGSLNLDLEEQNPNVQDILGELREKGGYTTICQESLVKGENENSRSH